MIIIMSPTAWFYDKQSLEDHAVMLLETDHKSKFYNLLQ